jgi:uncharacterized membrane protein (UPF0127 family)
MPLYSLRMVLLGTVGCAGTEPPSAAAPAPPVSCVEKVRATGAKPHRNEPTAPQAALPTTVLTIGSFDITAEVADDPKERASGLMFRDSLAAESGMVFVYPNARPRSFWMRNTCVPLSIAYIDAEGTIVSLADMQPLDENGVPSGPPAQYALEMEQGWFARKGVSVGDRIVGLPAASAH